MKLFHAGKKQRQRVMSVLVTFLLKDHKTCKISEDAAFISTIYNKIPKRYVDRYTRAHGYSLCMYVGTSVWITKLLEYKN